jgi:hypothetical protein
MNNKVWVMVNPWDAEINSVVQDGIKMSNKPCQKNELQSLLEMIFYIGKYIYYNFIGIIHLFGIQCILSRCKITFPSFGNFEIRFWLSPPQPQVIA